jgi:hypothetical protein
MALQITKTLPSGVEAEYHKIIYFSWDERGSETIKVALYKDKAARDAGLPPVEVNKYSWDAEAADGYLGADGYQSVEMDSILTHFYDKLKERETLFAGAIEV